MLEESYVPATDPGHPKWYMTRRVLIQLECAEEKRRLGLSPELLAPHRPLRKYSLAAALGMTAGAATLFVAFALDIIAWVLP